MQERPYVLLSAAASVDGYIDDATGERLLLSDAADLDRVDEVRAGCDAILVGAGTIRRDNPRLLVRSAARREARLARGLTASPVKVTLTRTGDLDPAASFFTTGDAARLVYAAAEGAAAARARLAGAATVIDTGRAVTADAILADLAARGIRRLEPSRRGLSFGELMAVMVVLLSVFLLAWEMLTLFHVFPIKLKH